MKTFKEIKTFLKEKNIPIIHEENNLICIRACSVGDNFYDYGESQPPLRIDKEYGVLKNDPRIRFLTCDKCCSCAGW